LGETYGVSSDHHHFGYAELIPWERIRVGIPDFRLWVEMVDHRMRPHRRYPIWEISLTITAR